MLILNVQISRVWSISRYSRVTRQRWECGTVADKLWYIFPPAEAEVPPDVRLMASIFKHIPKPAYIRQIAADFIEFMTHGGRFMSSHWRYNEGDYLAKYSRIGMIFIFPVHVRCKRLFKLPWRSHGRNVPTPRPNVRLGQCDVICDQYVTMHMWCIIIV